MRIQSTVAAAALGIALAGGAPRATPAPATFARDVRPILQSHCTICHASGAPSPMPLVTYEQVLPWAQKIKEQALTRRMPIWHAARGYGAFSNDPTLTPAELALLVEWADGDPGRTEGAEGARAGRAGSAEVLPAREVMTVHVHSGWVTGWTFVPGDPLITSATFTSRDGSTIGVWTAGDRAARLPPGAAIRVLSPVRVEIRRRQQTSYETPFTGRLSSLRLSFLPTDPAGEPQTPARRVRIQRVACGGTIGPSDASLIAVRPLLASRASAEVSVERVGGAQPALVGWFRDFDPDYPRIYWLDRPLDFVANARLTSDAPCELDLVLSSRR